ncbi:undecaprenyldiphospho-muramoylpentapeptide beta-N- acetylglucosaminyltransferase [Hyphomonas johnsonii MHS-2]|jgi:UDP-N-acetylglucosamine--N-acetylmuramyl-(pentapeptide) pyrophosphoryl-undecaprenol N-acetylglucosamine transferase|uniref:UDP-N-acetylglucosamine--N-acetylmuramyl-(pentapeptide) pyrophosphoryl-undecaprenol N-acetylglucosamine transferase n=2 Tax=Hyphomonas johnsonii TaxID=81031 RepID=A0A059FPZ3_9PROT|nr:undecaprenyldiphospho-muramoylpentapeptide beta-N- acetylglucosaminyltransferase [Hyphomonas johnsonii MHS-2]
MFPARAFADEMRARGWKVGLISDHRGLRYAADFPAEWKEEVRAASPNFRKPWALPGVAMKINAGIRRAARIMDETRPALVAGFGGYPAYPALAAAKRRGVPIIIHEQNAVLGRVNRQFATHAKLVASGFKRLDRLPAGAAHMPIGNPVREPIIAMRDVPYPPTDGKLTLLVTGGSQGSSIIGDTVPLAVADYIPASLRGRLKIVQQVRAEQMEGVRNMYRRAQVDADLAPFFPDMPERLASAHLVVARSGAGTVSELAVVGRPSILIPLAIAMDDHQAANAEALVDAEAADMILESNLYPKLLGALIAVRMEHGDDLRIRAARAKAVGTVTAARDLADMAERVAEL